MAENKNTKTGEIPEFLKPVDGEETGPRRTGVMGQKMAEEIAKLPEEIKSSEEPAVFGGVGAEIRETYLDRASEAITSRDEEYGKVLRNFENIAALWEPVFGHGVTVEQVALCMDLVKTARLISNPKHRDSWVDKIGYSAIGGELSEVTA